MSDRWRWIVVVAGYVCAMAAIITWRQEAQIAFGAVGMITTLYVTVRWAEAAA